jgi:DNA-directed RNA polymerase specialized sigma24 family protein/CheY-like chemotaxis protein
MSVSQAVVAHLPFLRRYARALTGSQVAGDAYVGATLEAALSDKDVLDQIGQGRVALYAAFNKIWSASGGTLPDRVDPAEGALATADERLAAITPANRQALLLTTIEDFTPSEAAEIMDISEAEAQSLVRGALEEIDAESATDVLIIEDEALISMQLEELVESLGHTVCGTATTRDEARAEVATRKPGLVLADIQLADGSSGIDAVNDILSEFSVPVIFITAYPEKLLTGDRPEPTYLVTKPFLESAVKAAISQAMFFRSTAEVA